ncbi:MAG: LAGLIDADG family homing endonuclease [archaeon]
MNCLALSSEILTKGGLKKITEVKKGDMVYAFNQKTHEIALKKCTGVFDNGKKEVFELSTLHHNIKATSNHPFLTVQKNGRGKTNALVWKTIAQLKKGDQIISLKNQPGCKQFYFKPLKVSKKGDFKVNKLTEVRLPGISSADLMEFFGIFVGDGWTRLNRGETGFALPEGKPARSRLLMLQERLFGLKPRLDKNYVYYNSVNLARFIDSLGFNKPAKEKTVPGWVFTLPANEKEAFIRGLMQSDGYKTGNSSRFVSASFELLKRTRLLLQTMGYRAGKIHRQEKKKGTHCVYRRLLKDCEYGYICFSERDDWNIEKFKSPYKYQNFLVESKCFETEKVQSIKSVGIEPTLDLRVEGEHNFIADGVVVHNTGIQRSGATPMFANTTTSPAGSKVDGKQEPKKPLPLILASHGIKYVATVSAVNVFDLHAKVKKALATPHASFIHAYSVCPVGWYTKSDAAIEISKLAINARVFPMYEIENGVLKFTQKVEKADAIPVEEYLKVQGRFKHLKPEEIAKIQEYVDARYDYLRGIEGKKAFDCLY